MQAMLAGKKLSPCDVAALKKCLEENKGDRHKVSLHLLLQGCCALQPQFCSTLYVMQPFM
jgi:hypothetical protein